MNILFLTLADVRNIKIHSIFNDLIRKFRDEGHEVYIASPTERKYGLPTQLYEVDGVKLLKVKILNIMNTSYVEKGISTIFISSYYKQAIRKYLGDKHFDLILYSTPPITFTNVVRWLKRKNPKALCYLLLKDIFPQNAVDLGLFGKGSLPHRYFRVKERQLYNTSDFIGCMSPANIDFILRNNHDCSASQVEVAPNSCEIKEYQPLTPEEKKEIRIKYHLPTDCPIFIYGGNLGKPQGISYLIQCLEANKNRSDCHFLIVGDGTEFHRLEDWMSKNHDMNVTLLQFLPKADYDRLVQACNVGLIFLDHRFTIPNYPSRMLTYLEYRMPVLCATDSCSDIGRIAEKNGYGFWCESKRV